MHSTAIDLTPFSLQMRHFEPRSLREGIVFVACSECGAAADLARVVDRWQRPFCNAHAGSAVVRGVD